MALHYENLDVSTHAFMSSEVGLDLSHDTLYMSLHLNEFGAQNYVYLLEVKGVSHVCRKNGSKASPRSL